MKIEASTSLSKEEVERLKQEAAQHAEEDLKKKDHIEAKNMAETTIYAAEKALSDAGDNVPVELKDTVRQKIDALKEIKDGDKIEEIRNAQTELSSELQKIGQSMYNTKDAQKADTPEPKKDEGENNDDDDTQQQPTRK